MPTIKQTADREADEAERGDDEQLDPDEAAGDDEQADEGEGDGEAEPEPAPPAPPSERAAERAFSQIEQAGDSYTEFVAEIQAETDLGLLQCPLCPVPGYVLAQPMTDVDPNQRLAVLTVLGEVSAEAPPPHPNLHRCTACDGHGLLPTGSRRAEFLTQPCPVCGGNGYLDQVAEQAMADARLQTGLPPEADQVPPPLAQNNVIPAATVTQGGHTFTLVLGGSPDQVGRLAGHPLWGQPYEAGGL